MQRYLELIARQTQIQHPSPSVKASIRQAAAVIRAHIAEQGVTSND